MSLHLSTIVVFPLWKFQFFTTLSLSHSYIDYLFKFYNVIYTITHFRCNHSSSTTKKFSTILIVVHIFQSSFSLSHFEKTSSIKCLFVYVLSSKFRFFTTLSLSHSYIDYLFKFYHVIYTNAHSRYNYSSSTTKTLAQY